MHLLARRRSFRWACAAAAVWTPTSATVRVFCVVFGGVVVVRLRVVWTGCLACSFSSPHRDGMGGHVFQRRKPALAELLLAARHVQRHHQVGLLQTATQRGREGTNNRNPQHEARARAKHTHRHTTDRPTPTQAQTHRQTHTQTFFEVKFVTNRSRTVVSKSAGGSLKARCPFSPMPTNATSIGRSLIAAPRRLHSPSPSESRRKYQARFTQRRKQFHTRSVVEETLARPTMGTDRRSELICRAAHARTSTP